MQHKLYTKYTLKYIFYMYWIRARNSWNCPDRFAQWDEAVSVDNILIGVCAHIWWNVPPKFHQHSSNVPLFLTQSSRQKNIPIKEPCLQWELWHYLPLALKWRKWSHMLWSFLSLYFFMKVVSGNKQCEALKHYYWCISRKGIQETICHPHKQCIFMSIGKLAHKHCCECRPALR